jgi:hypothetical protein
MKKKNPQEFLLKRIRRKPKTNSSGTNTTTNTPSRSQSMDEQYFNSNHRSTQSPNQNKSIMTNQPYLDGKSNVRFPSQNMDTLIAIPPLEDRGHRSDDEKHDYQQQELVTTPDVINKTLPGADDFDQSTKKKGFINKFTDKMKKNRDSGTGTPDTPSADDGHFTPAPLLREGTWFSRISTDEKTFLGATRDFGLSTTAIPGKLIKGGYNKFKTQNNLKGGLQYAQSSTQQAKYLAKKIYTNILGPESTRDTIVEADMYPFFRTTKEANFAFGLFDTDGNGDISKRELRSGCIRIYRERKNLTRSMRDLSQATGKLDIILMIIFIVVWAIIVCAAFGVNVGTDLMPLWSAFVAASFVFGTSAKDAFESMIFVFVTVSIIYNAEFFDV